MKELTTLLQSSQEALRLTESTPVGPSTQHQDTPGPSGHQTMDTPGPSRQTPDLGQDKVKTFNKLCV